MADDQGFETWDSEFLEKAIQATDAAACSSSSSNTYQPPPKLFPPPPPPHYAPHISYSPPRELSQRVKEENHRNVSDTGFDFSISVNGINRALSSAPPRELIQRLKEDNHRNAPDIGFDCPASLNGINRGLNSAPPFQSSSRLHEEDKHCKQQEINRLKEELGRVSKVLTNLEQECLELRKDREKNEKHFRAVPPVNGSKDAEASCTTKSNTKSKNHFEEESSIHPGTKGVIPCKTVGVQTDEHTVSDELTIKNNLLITYHSRKLADIWEPGNDQQPRNNLVSKLFMACGTDLQVLFGCLGLNIPSKKTTTKMDSFKLDLYMDPTHCIQSVEAAKVSHLYITLTKISYDTGRLIDLFEALVDLCHVENVSPHSMFSTEDDCSQITLCVSCGFETYFKYGKQKVSQCTVLRDNVIINDPSTCDNPHHPVLTRLINPMTVDDSSSCLTWHSYFQTMHQVITRHSEENIRVEAVSIMNILLLRTDAFTERQMYGEVAVFETISELLKKEAGVGVQKQSVDLLYLVLNCPNLMLMCKEEGRNTETTPAFKGLGAVLDGLADCLACRGIGNGAPKALVLKVQRKAIIVLAFLASSGRRGFEILLGRINFLFLILQILESEIHVESSEHSDDFRERRLVIREALILLNRLASSFEYSTPVLQLLTNRRDIAGLTIYIATSLSRKDTLMRDAEIVDLLRIFKKRVFAFLGDTK
ncbi:hypothetical protein LXL04_005995 [Taraxacum kok-saghyz]